LGGFFEDVGFTCKEPAIEIIAHHDQDLTTLNQRVRSEPDAKARDRARCVLLAIDGLTAVQIAQRVGRSRRFVQRWCYAYRDGGLEGLQVKSRSGRPPILSPPQQQAFRGRVLAGPTDDDGVCTLRGRDLQRILAAEFGKPMSLSGVYDLLHRLDLSVLKPRPKHRKADPEVQQRWLDRAPFLSSKSAGTTPVSGSRSGSMTKRAPGRAASKGV
jgi:transposase